MKMLWCATALAVASVAMPVHAQSKKELVQKLLQLQQPGAEALARTLAQQTAGQFMQAAGAGLQRLPADKREAVGKTVEADIKTFYGEIEPLLRDRAVKLAPATVGVALEEKFTEDELKQLIAWAESPVNKKYKQLAPEIENSLAEKLVADTRPAVEPKIKALEANLAKKLGAQPTPAKPAAKTKN